MAVGYLVTLGDGKLDPGDTITGASATFTVDRDLGPGTWQFSGEAGGTTYVDSVEPGQYMLADNGNVYFVPDWGMVDSVSSAQVNSHQSDGTVSGTDDNDTIGNSYTEVDGDAMNDGDGGGPSGNGDRVEAGDGDDMVFSGDDNDTVYAGTGNDTVQSDSGDDEIYGQAGNDNLDAGDGADVVYGGDGADAISAGQGNDTVYGDAEPADPVSINTSNFNDTSNGFTLTAQNVEGGVLSSASSSNISTSNGALGANGAVSDTDSGQNSQLAYDKASGLSENLTATFDEPVTNANFSFETLFTSNFGETGHWAVYNDGNLVAEGDFSETNPGSGSGTVDISGVGPFDQLVLTANLQSDGSDGSDYSVSNITFVPATTDSGSGGADMISGGAGDDVLYGDGGNDTIDGDADNDEIHGGRGADMSSGGAGDDTIYTSEGDTVTGGDGDDTFILQDLGEAGAADIFINGGTEGDTDHDVLDVSQVNFTNLNIVSTDTLTGEMSGNLTLDDGSVVYFNNIEEIVCFGQGTHITTPSGPTAVETLKEGDMVMTRDFGPQPVLCATQTTVLTQGASRAVQFAPGAWGNKDTIVLSQNHRVVLAGAQAQLLYGTEEVLIPAKALLGRPGISLGSSGSIMSYYHFVLPQHSIVFSDGLLSESFYPTRRNLLNIGDHARQVILSSMLKHGLDPDTYGDTVRRTAKTYEVFCLAG